MRGNHRRADGESRLIVVCGKPDNRIGRLPFGLVADKADAKFRRGVLTISVPKSEQGQAKTKKIAIA
ncbi:MAG: Hsp20 family protein [Alphaproteobacteria bacterium]|nr:Hsp20 family protein [Alphaproteobacteria bacterium]